MLRQSLASRLAALYALLLAVTIILVILASSIALVYELAGFTTDIVIAKHEEARVLAAQYELQGSSLKQSAPKIAEELAGIGLRVGVFDRKGKFLGGDPSSHPHSLDRAVHGQLELNPPTVSIGKGGGVLEPLYPGKITEHSSTSRPTQAPLQAIRSHATVGGLLYPEGAQNQQRKNATLFRVDVDNGRGHAEPWSITAINGGYVTFSPDGWLIFTNLVPYWRVIITIAVLAILLSWFIGRVFARQALAPLNEVTSSLQALSAGDYTQRRFVTARGDEIAVLTGAYNDAAASVAVAMQERRNTEERMRRFVADAGHELRTPLTVIAGYIDVLRRGALEEPKVARDILATMSLEKEHMRGLIDRLMRLARLDAEAPPNRETVDVAELLRSQCEAARRLDDGRQIDYSVDGVQEIYADKTELSEAVWNIVENALKYAPGAPIHLRAYRDKTGPTVLSVRDDGPGMTESERLHAFERFYRGDVRGEIGGTGLGLAIAKRAVSRNGGTIDIDSAPGHGTTVNIKF
ncbi:MAG: HAMP domain-containing histidine kinase [Candidatus Eremiobacteraeota bacterium]|nr:HAMP domain-containing histidine kinase [Candidatus Eremiobacteraeota bacterium]